MGCAAVKETCITSMAATVSSPLPVCDWSFILERVFTSFVVEMSESAFSECLDTLH